MSERLHKVEQLLRREIAEMLLRGELRDPRLQPIAAISITGVRVSPDLGSARVFVDALDGAADLKRVLAGLNAAAGAVRAALGPKIRLQRTPSLRFERDESVGRGLAVEQVLAELERERRAAAAAEAADAPPSAGEPDAAEADATDDTADATDGDGR